MEDNSQFKTPPTHGFPFQSEPAEGEGMNDLKQRQNSAQNHQLLQQYLMLANAAANPFFSPMSAAAMMQNHQMMHRLQLAPSMGPIGRLPPNMAPFMYSTVAATQVPQSPYIFQANTPDASTSSEGRTRRKKSARPSSHPERHIRGGSSKYHSKVRKTDTLDLQLRLDTSQDEVQRFREELERRNLEVAELQHLVATLKEENKAQRSRLQTLEEAQIQMYRDPKTIRDLRTRMEYLRQIEMRAQQRQQDSMENSMEHQLNPNMDPSLDPVIESDTHPHLEYSSSAAPSSLSYDSRSPANSPSMMITSPHNDASSSELESKQGISPNRANWGWEPWNQEIPRPFREKIDLSKIELRPVEPPPNLVESARMEYYDRERLWHLQQQHVQRLHDAKGSRPSKPVPTSTIKPAQPYAAKIDLNEKISQLRKTQSNPLMRVVGQPPIPPSLHSHHLSQSLAQVPASPLSMAMIMSEDPMDTIQDESDFLASAAGGDDEPFATSMFDDAWDMDDYMHPDPPGPPSGPTPTARIWRDELNRKGTLGLDRH